MSIKSKIAEFLSWYTPEIIGVAVVGSIVGFIAYCIIGTNANTDYIESNAERFLGEQGLEIVVREGYTRSPSWGKCHGGGKVWYQVVREANKNVTYRLFLSRWGKGNIQIWNMASIGEYRIIDGSTPVSITP